MASGNLQSNANSHQIPSESSPSGEREEYIDQLRQWVEQARLWHRICAGFPQYYNQTQLHTNSIPSWETFFNHNVFATTERQTEANDTQFFPTFNVPQAVPQVDPSQGGPAFRRGSYEFTIPPLWKRLVAEFLDFIILFILKLLLTFFLLESFNFLNIEHYGLETLQKHFENPKVAMQMSAEILVLEIVHRFVVCCYEAYWLKGGQCATPGKWFMGLMVIRADTITEVSGRPEGTVVVRPSSPLGLQKAFIRAILKNLFIGLMLPICFALYVFRFNRTGYDIVASSLVVEWNHNLPFRPID